MQRFRYLLGLLTLVVTVVIGWMFLDWTRSAESASLHLRIEFADAGGIRPGASVRTRGVVVGIVDRVGLRTDGAAAVVELSLDANGARFAREGSQFWIVRPRVGGLTTPVDGLDTLIRDPYLAFEPASAPAAALVDYETLTGAEVPPRDDAVLSPVHSDDLTMTLLTADASGLNVGAAVRYRGRRVGDVRSIDLPTNGVGVLIGLRIDANARRTVTDRSAFWVARPRMRGSLLNGFELTDLGAALFPFVNYTTPEDGGVPILNGSKVVEVREVPESEAIRWPEDRSSEGDGLSGDAGPIHMVEVLFEAEESDWLSSNDRVYRKSVGLLYRGQDGSSLVLTTRSACDGAYVMSDWIGSVDIEWETLRAITVGNRALGASRRWVGPEGTDLAVLQVEWFEDQRTTRAPIRFDADPGSGVQVIAPLGRSQTIEGDLPYLGEGDGGFRGAALVDGDGGVVGLVTVDDEGRWSRVGIGSVPADLRPAAGN